MDKASFRKAQGVPAVGTLGKYAKFDAPITGKRTISKLDAPITGKRTISRYDAPVYGGKQLSKSAQKSVDTYHATKGKKS